MPVEQKMEKDARGDSWLRCDRCGRAFAASLMGGWPVCCGYTMRLVSTTADVARATAEAVGS